MRYLLALVLTGACLAAQEWSAWEGNVYRAIHEDAHCTALDYFNEVMLVVSDTKTNFLVPLGLYSLGRQREYDAAKAATASLALTAASVVGLKLMVNRDRPEELQDPSPRWDSSFPSGHTAFAVSTSFVYGSCYPKLKIPLAGYCVLVGLSRVYSGEHFPTDVLAGALLGAGIGYTVAHFRKSIADFP